MALFTLWRCKGYHHLLEKHSVRARAAFAQPATVVPREVSHSGSVTFRFRCPLRRVGRF